MGIFWDYFRKTLRLPWIQKPGPLAMLTDGGATSLDPARDDILQLRDQFSPERCEAAFLANFARSRGIVQSPMELEDHWLARIRFAYQWWARGGRAATMVEVFVQGFGFEAARVINLRTEDPLKWASFRVETENPAGESPVVFEQVKWAINEIKPARSKLAELRYHTILPADAPVLGATTISQATVMVGPRNFSAGILYKGAAVCAGETVRIMPLAS